MIPGGGTGLSLFSHLFSRSCLSCGEKSRHRDLCPDCENDPIWSYPPREMVRGERRVRIVYLDAGPVARLFRLAKNRGNRKAMDILFDRARLSALVPDSAKLLLPVPPSKSRLIRRDLAIPDAFAFRVHRFGSVPVSFSGLVRTKDSPQKARSRSERRESIFSPNFQLVPTAIADWPKEGVVLVDDLMVTGWTLRSIDNILAREGVEVMLHLALLFREELSRPSRITPLHSPSSLLSSS